jgi:hypothetical protein
VVREHLDPVVTPVRRKRLDPLRGKAVLLGPSCPRDLRVRDVAYEGVKERELQFAGDSGAAIAANELFALERVQRVVERRDSPFAE